MHTLTAVPYSLLQVSAAKMWQSMSWNWELINHFLPYSLCLQLEAMMVSLHLEDHDQLAWKGTSLWQFSIKFAFHMQMVRELAQTDKVWGCI